MKGKYIVGVFEFEGFGLVDMEKERRRLVFGV